MMRFDNVIYLPSGNTARGFKIRDLGNGRMQVEYVYTDRRRNHQTARRFTAEFLNGHIQSITARSARGGRVETFKSSAILAELREMLAEVNRVNEALTSFRKDAQRVIETPVKVETNEQDSASVEDDTASNTSTDLKDTVELLRGVVMINTIITLVTLGIVWYNL